MALSVPNEPVRVYDTAGPWGDADFHGDATRGLLVDELLGKQEVVIKNLGETFRKQDLLAGAAILGDGRVGLILDVDTLVNCQRINN